MPGIIAHHLFGEDAYGTLRAVVGEGDAPRAAFLLGNQGPDPLLCLKVLPPRFAYRTIGNTMHVKAPTELLAALHRRFVAEAGCEASAGAGPGADAPTRRAFALGFLCHYLLDSTAHPLVIAQQRAYCDAGVAGLTGENAGEVHALIETELDEYALATRRGLTVGAFSPHREVFGDVGEILPALSPGVAAVAADAYGVRMPAGAFANGVRLHRIAQASLDSKRDGLRRLVDYGRLAGSAYTRIQAMTHADTLRTDSPFANSEHLPFPHPFAEGRMFSASFDELYDAALARACELAPSFAQTAFTPPADLPNFYGK